MAIDEHRPAASAGPWRSRLRYLFANSLGAMIDLVVAAGVNVLLAPPLWVAAGLGVAAGAIINYFVHEMWTFGSGGNPAASRAIAYIASCLVVLVLRVGLVAALHAWAGDALPDLAILGIAFVVTFLINYLIAARLFRRGG